ncbi:hypothetical protein DRO26_04485 [Candidatus Bathyarchaeota archaeon]|nr:MAG: hypothetical protein DRO26_04485 [Candidatus Bathyarchaeota archaeon]
MLGRIFRTTSLMVLFWVVFHITSWLLAKMYMPWVKETIIGTMFPNVLKDLIIWFGVLFAIGLVLLLFKKLFYTLFWFEVSKAKTNQ